MADPGHELQLRDQALSELAQARPGAPSGPGVQALVEWLAPVIQVRVTRVLVSHGRGRAMSDLRATVEEYVQMVFGKVFEDEGRVLALWEPQGGLSLRNWIGRFAQLRARDVVRSGKRDPWRHEAAPPEHLERIGGVTAPDDRAVAAELWEKVRAAVLASQSEQGQALFRLMFEEDRTTAEIQSETDLSSAAVFQWRRRLRIAIREAWESAASVS